MIHVLVTAQDAAKLDQPLKDQLERLKGGKKLLYVSFLPGDENTRLLITASQKYHFNTGVFWMTRGEGMHNYNGTEKGIDLGLIHVAEMEVAAWAAGYRPFVSSCMDIGARDTASVNATVPTDRLILDLAAVIRQYRPDVLIVGHKYDSIGNVLGFNEWMDSICQSASRVAADNSQLDNKSLEPFSVNWMLADLGKTELGQPSIPLILNGIDSLLKTNYKQLAHESKLAFRSIYADLDNIPLRQDTARLKLLKEPKASGMEAVARLFSIQGAKQDYGVWSRLSAAGRNVESIKDRLNLLEERLKRNNLDSVVAALGKIANSLRLQQKVDGKTSINQDSQWVLDRIQTMQQTAVGMKLLASTDIELGVLGQDFRLMVTQRQNPMIHTACSVLWLKVPGLTDKIVPVLDRKAPELLLDTSLHIPLFGGTYQPFWLNKSLRSDGSYNIDTRMQGRLSDTTSYHVVAELVAGTDSLQYSIPVYYRHFDRMKGLVRQPFYTIEPMLISLTPTVLLTHVLRDKLRIRQKELQINIKTLFKDTAQVVLFKVRQVGIGAVVNGQHIQSDSASFVNQDAGYITPTPGGKMKVDIVLSDGIIKHFNPLTPILKPSALLKLPEGVQKFSSNIKSIGYPYQSPRLYNYHSQTIVVGDTIHTRGSRLLYLNGISGDVFENAFNQLGYAVIRDGFKGFASLAEQIDIKSGVIPRFVKDSLAQLDAIVISGADESLQADSTQFARLQYLLNAYVRGGGRLINLSHDPALEPLLPARDSIRTDKLFTGSNVAGELQVDTNAVILNRPNKVPASYFRKWEGVFARGVIFTRHDSTLYPLKFNRATLNNISLAPIGIDLLGKGAQINCFIELSASLSNGNAKAYKLLANILAKPPEKQLH